MTRWLSLLVLLAACGPKHGTVQDAPPWAEAGARDAVRLDLASTLLDHERPDAALAMLTDLEKPDAPHALLLRGRALHQKGLNPEAEEQLLGARRALSRDPEPHRQLGFLYADTNRAALAIEEFQSAAELDPNHAATWNNLGFLLGSQQRHDEALAALQHAVALDGSQQRYQNNLGFTYAALERYDDALAAFLAAAPPADAYANMATAYELAGAIDLAVHYYTLALEYNPKHAPATDGLERLTGERQ